MDPRTSALAEQFVNLLTPLVERMVADELQRLQPIATAQTPQPLKPDKKAVLTYTDVHARYGIGRQEWNRLINSGELKATARRMRGGHMGYVVSTQEAARVLGGDVYAAA